MSESNLFAKGPLDKTFVAMHRFMTMMRDAEPLCSCVVIAYDSADKDSKEAMMVSSLALPSEVEALIEVAIEKMMPLLQLDKKDKSGTPPLALLKPTAVWAEAVNTVVTLEPSIRIAVILHNQDTPLTTSNIVGITNIGGYQDMRNFLIEALNSATIRKVLQGNIRS